MLTVKKSLLENINQFAQKLYDPILGAEKPKLYCNETSQLHRVLEQIPQLKEKYRPTPWLSNCHAHLAYFDLIKKKTIKLEYDHFEQLTMADGGVTAIAWYGYALPETTPTIIVMHTITGTPESMCELVKDLHEYTNWRIALCIRRGHAGLPMPVPQISLFGSTRDLREQIDYIQHIFPKSDLYAVGSSAGTGLLVRYLGEQGEDTPFKAAFALCPGYNTETGFKNVHPVYSRIMTKKLLKAFIYPYQQIWQQIPAASNLLTIKTLQEFENKYFQMAGFENYQSYSEATNPIYVFENLKIPLLILNSEDDPVCSIKNFQPYKNTIRQMENVAVIVTKKGSHCGFYEGVKVKSWATRLIANFFKKYQSK